MKLPDGAKITYTGGAQRLIKGNDIVMLDGETSMRSNYQDQYNDDMTSKDRFTDLDIVKIEWTRQSRQIYNPLTGKKIDISEESYQAMKKDWK